MNEHIRDKPAFPIEGFSYRHEGISKRFYAACKALQSIMSKPSLFDIHVEQSTTQEIIEYLVTDAYKIADELIRQEFNTEE